MSRNLLFFFFVVSFFQGSTQDPVTNKLASPYHSIYTHLYYLQAEHYDERLAASPFRGQNVSQERALQAAIQLKQLLDGSGIFVDMELLPREVDYIDASLEKKRFVLTSDFPSIYLEKSGNKWVYPLESVKAIEKAHQTLFRLGTDKLLDLLPRLGTREVMGLHMYQYIGILFLAFLSALVHKVFSFLFNRLFLSVVKKAGYETLAEGYLIPIARPTSLFVVLALLVIYVPVLQLPPDMSHYIILGMKALLPLFGTMVFYRMVNVVALYLDRVAKRTQSTLDDQLVPLIRKTLKTFVVVIGTLFVLDNLNIDIIPLLTGLSIGGLAFALAAQDTIKNFFGSLMIFIDKPFQIGDWITSGDIDGTVEEVGFRSSRVRTFRNSVMYVPNGKMADSLIDNHGLRQYRRFFTQIAITYDTPPELIDGFVEGLRKIVLSHPDTRKDYYNVFLNDLGPSSLNIMFYIFFEVPDWTAELKARHEVLLEIIRFAKQLGVHFAFPTQTLHVENFPGQPSLSPLFPDKNGMDATLDAYFKK